MHGGLRNSIYFFIEKREPKIYSEKTTLSNFYLPIYLVDFLQTKNFRDKRLEAFMKGEFETSIEQITPFRNIIQPMLITQLYSKI